MSGRRRRNDSKWDSKEDPPVPDDGWPRRGGVQVSRGSDEGYNNGQRWSDEKDQLKRRYDSDFSTREDMVGARSTWKDGYNSVDGGRKFDSWEGDGTYGARISPGLDGWRKRNRSPSSKDRHDRSPGRRNRNWRRSPGRSRSPVRIRREVEIYDRSCSRRSLSSEPCKNFAAGRCRRGNDCRNLHEGSQHHNVAWDGRQRTGDSSKYSATLDTRDPSNKSSRSAELCNHFQRGTCRKGSSCRYIHQLANDALDKSYQKDVGVFENDKRRRDISPELGDCESRGHLGSSDGLTNDWSTDNRLEHGSGLERKMWDNMSSALGATENENVQPLGIQEELTSTGKLILDTNMTPDWNPPMQSSEHVSQEKGQSNYGMMSLAHNGTPMTVQEQPNMPDASNQIYFSSVIQPVKADFPPMQTHHCLNENGASSFLSYDRNSISRIAGLPGDTTLAVGMAYKADLSNQSIGLGASSCFDPVGSHQFTISAEHSKSRNIFESISKPLSDEGNQVHQSGFVDPNASPIALGGPLLQNIASGEQIRQLTDLSTSLAHLLGAGKELPQIYAALNSQQMMDVSSALSAMAACNIPPPIQSNMSVVHQKQYDPLSDSIEPNKPEDASKPLFFPVPTGHVNADIINANNVQAECDDTHMSSRELKETGEMGVTEIEKEKESLDGKDRGGKKTKEAKSLRAFKFSLVEYVKELMKPTWKEGQMDKEAYKTTVRKVVDKVTGTMQGNIPQSQDKIDQYLTFAKPKLTKLVQAYVEKSRKA